jgi:hypothetical protein
MLNEYHAISATCKTVNPSSTRSQKYSQPLPTMIVPYGSHLSLHESFSTLSNFPISANLSTSSLVDVTPSSGIRSLAGLKRTTKRTQKPTRFSCSTPNLMGQSNSSTVSLSNLAMTPVWQKVAFWARNLLLFRLFNSVNGTCLDHKITTREAEEAINYVLQLYRDEQQEQIDPALPEPGKHRLHAPKHFLYLLCYVVLSASSTLVLSAVRHRCLDQM